MMIRCLGCYLPLLDDENDFHLKCSKKLFGQSSAPLLPYDETKMEKLAEQVIKSQTTVTGVQPKLSLHLASAEHPHGPKRFTIVGLWGDYILKPPTNHYPLLPEVEDVTMHLAALTKIKVVPHSLIRLETGNLAYITKRIDRVKKTKLPMEDMCQLTEHLSEDKYRGSYEQIAKHIKKYSSNPGLDVVNFYELVLFSFLVGNADMHLKNFSLIRPIGMGYILSPVYDLVATAIVNPSDDEDVALTLNGKKKKLKKNDFIDAMKGADLDTKQIENIFKKMNRSKSAWLEFIEISFLSDEYKSSYRELIENRFDRIS